MRLAARPRPMTPSRSAFAGFRFPAEVIMVVVRWYLRYGLSYRDVEELLAERLIHHHRGRGLRGLRTDKTTQVIAGHAFIQNLRRGHYELAVDTPPTLRVAAAFTELAQAI